MSNSAQPNYNGIPVQKSVYLFFGKAVPVLMLFLITILYSRRLSYHDYGTFQSVWMYANLLNVITGFGVTSLLLSSNLSSLAAFIKRHLLKIICAYSVLWIAAMTIFLLYGKNFSTAVKSLLILFVLIQSISIVLETILIKFHKERIVFLISFIYSLLFFGWHYYILLNGFSLHKLIEGIIILSVARFIAMCFFRQKTTIAEEPLNDNRYFKHWVFLGFNDITGVLSRWIDKLLLVYLLTPAEFALFFNGSFEIPLFGLLVSVAGSVMLIEISKSLSAKTKVIHLFTESFRLLSLIVFPLFLFLLFFRTELFAVIFKNKYDASIPIFLISIFILPIRINNYGSILQYYQQGNKIMAGSVLDIGVAIILMILLYPFFGTGGIALAIVTATYCQVFYYMWQSAKVLHTAILSLIPIKALTVTFLITLVLYACLYYSLYKVADNVKLLAAVIATGIFISIGLYLYFSKKRSITYGLI
ncbi:MAG: oligosaccharide flippase family protein [Ginsengibacter sp.]